MEKQNEQFPEHWIKLTTPNYYSYKDIVVKRIDCQDGKIELVARDFLGRRCSVQAPKLPIAMHQMEKLLTCNS